MPIFSNSERKEAELFSELTWCNPFTPKRQQIERALAKKHYRKPELSSMRGISANMDVILPRLEALIERAQKRPLKALGNDRDRHLYRDLIIFHLYHENLSAMMDYIERAHMRGRSEGSLSKLYLSFCNKLNRFPIQGAEWFGYTSAHLFACFFQVVSAYYHIMNGLMGRSEIVDALRARVWQSIFTVDMERYQRCLYDKMGDVITLVCGPSGTGKEIVARAIGRSRFIPFDEKKEAFAEDFMTAFYAINLNAFSPTLIESELFGHRKGAFTGALENRMGYFEACGAHGTVFLDEIGEAELSVQVKLLRVLQTRQYQRLGDTRTLNFSGKVMAATNRDLAKEIEAGRFREDFYYRLCADKVQTCSLREILSSDPSELPIFVKHILEGMLGGEDASTIFDEVIDSIERHVGADYEWFGNFRELEQCVRNIVIHGDYQKETREHISATHTHLNSLAQHPLPVSQLLSHYISSVYHSSGNNLEATARLLEIDRRTVKKYVHALD